MSQRAFADCNSPVNNGIVRLLVITAEQQSRQRIRQRARVLEAVYIKNSSISGESGLQITASAVTEYISSSGRCNLKGFLGGHC